MKKLVIAATGLLAFATSGAFAQTTNGRTNIVQRPAVVANGQYVTNDPYVVIANDHVVGRDPDVNVRSFMRRDSVQNEY